MSEVYVMDHPLIQHKITHIRKTEVQVGQCDFPAPGQRIKRDRTHQLAQTAQYRQREPVEQP